MKELLQKSLQQGADAADLYYLERKNDEVVFKNSKLESISTKNLAGFNIQVKVDGRIGSAASSNLKRQDEALKTALAASKNGDQIDYDFLKPEELPNGDSPSEQIWDIDYDQLIADGEKAIQMIKGYDPKINVSVQFIREKQTKQYFNSPGCDYQTTSDIMGISVYGQLLQEESMLSAGKSMSLRTTDYNIEEIAQETIEKIKLGRVEKDLTGGKMPVLLTPEALGQMIFLWWAGLSGDNIRSGVSPLKGKLGQQIFDERLTIIDDMLMDEGRARASFDDEGTPAQTTPLFEDGVLKNYLLDLKSAHALGLEPNGKAFRRYFWKPPTHVQKPTPWISNWSILPGQVTFNDMIADIKEGLVIDGMFGLMMGNIVRGDLDTDIDMAYKIENGKIVGRVKDAAIGANIYEILKDQIVAIENKQHLIAGFLGTAKFPHILLKDVNIVR